MTSGFEKHDTSIESAVKVCIALLGEPSSRNADEVRWGTHGSKKLILTGEYAGQFNDFENDRKGNYINVVQWFGNGEPIWKQLDDIGVDRLHLVGGRFQDHKWMKGHPVRDPVRYLYLNEYGEHQYTVTRWDFADVPGKTYTNDRVKKGKAPILYNLPALTKHPNDLVFIVEGEKNVETLNEYGLLAVTNDGGCGNWLQDFAVHFKDRSVVIVEDNDKGGRKWVNSVRDSIKGVATEINFIHFRDKREKYDATDFLAEHSKSDFLDRAGDYVDFTERSAIVSDTLLTPLAPKAEKFDLLSLQDLRNRPPPTWLIDSFICEGELAVIFGPPAQGKTFLSLDMALHIAAGRNWHGFETKKGRVLYIAGEGLAGLPSRIQAWLSHHGYDDFENFMVLPQAVNFLSKNEMAKLHRSIEALDQAFDVIFVDTVSRALLGGDENSAEVMGRFIASCESLQLRHNATVIGIHHSGKDSSKGLRGSSSLLGAVTSSLLVTKIGDQIELRSEKQKDIELPQPLRFEMTKTEVSRGLIVTESVVLELAALIQGDRRRRRLSPNELIVINALESALTVKGRYSKNSDVLGYQKVVGLVDWRDEAGKKMNFGSKNWYRAFKTAATKLIADGFVKKRNDDHWLPKPSD